VHLFNSQLLYVKVSLVLSIILMSFKLTARLREGKLSSPAVTLFIMLKSLKVKRLISKDYSKIF